jgi:hypothetical protein
VEIASIARGSRNSRAFTSGAVGDNQIRMVSRSLGEFHVRKSRRRAQLIEFKPAARLRDGLNLNDRGPADDVVASGGIAAQWRIEWRRCSKPVRYYVELVPGQVRADVKSRRVNQRVTVTDSTRTTISEAQLAAAAAATPP